MKVNIWHSLSVPLLLLLPSVQCRLQRAHRNEVHSHSGISHGSSLQDSHLHHKRAANPACLKSAEGSCYNLAANCINSINSGNRNNMWSLKPCVAAATCYGVGDLIAGVNCQTGLNIRNQDQASLNYDPLYAAIVGQCAWASGGCPITQQNYIDFYYHSLDVISTTQWPSSANVVIGYWSGVTAWTATGNSVPYTNFNDYLHYSSYPPVTNPSSPPSPSASGPKPSTSVPSTTTPPVTTPPDPNQPRTSIPWNPNPVPSSGAPSQTFVRSSSTVVIAIPTTTTTITVGGATITVAPGGTPVGTFPADVTFPNAVTPTWNSNPIIPTSQSSATFISGTWTSVVALPTASDVPVKVDGPPDDDDDDDDDFWFLILGLGGVIIIGNMPAGIIVIGGITPVPVPPPNWPPSPPWVPPPPPGGDPDDPDDDDDDDDEDFCPLYFPDIPTEPDEDESGLARRSTLVARADGREWGLRKCGNLKYSKSGFNLANSPGIRWYTVNSIVGTVDASTTLKIHAPQTGRPPRGPVNTIESSIHEHLFEFRYLTDFFAEQLDANQCGWLTQEFWVQQDTEGQLWKDKLFDAIDQPANSVWTDDIVNKAKSSVSNNLSGGANNPPLSGGSPTTKGMSNTFDYDPLPDKEFWIKVEMYIKSFAMLGQYFDETSAAFRATAERVQRILAEYTPTTPLNPPLDARFHTYATQTFGDYNNRVQARGINMLAFYKNRMDNILAQKRLATGNPALQVPQCFPVYHDPLIGGVGGIGGIFGPVGAVNLRPVPVNNLIPAAIPHPICNTAGTEGDLHFRYNNNVPVLTAGNPTPRYKIMGVGKRFYGLSRIVPGANGNTYAWLLVSKPPGCPNVEGLSWAPAGFNIRGHTKAEFDPDCLGATTLTARARLTPVDANGNPRQCFIYNLNNGSNEFHLLCGAQGDVDTCITNLNTLFNAPNGNRGDLDLHFNP